MPSLEQDQAVARVRAAAETLRLAVGVARGALERTGTVEAGMWRLCDRAAEQLEEQLDELERAS